MLDKQFLKKLPQMIRFAILIVVVICAVLMICLIADPIKGDEKGSTYYVGMLRSLEQDKLVLQFYTGKEQIFHLEKGVVIPEQLKVGDTIAVRASWKEKNGPYLVSRVAVADPISREKLEEAIRGVIMEHQKPVKENQFACFDYVDVSTVMDGVTAAVSGEGDSFFFDRVTTYGIILEQVYVKRNGQLQVLETKHTHAALTFRVTDAGEFVPIEYWLPGEDTYEQDVQEKFGDLPPLSDYLAQQEKRCLEQAQAYFDQQKPPKEPGDDIDFVSAEPDRYYPFIYDPNDVVLLDRLHYFDHFVDMDALQPGSLYIIDKKENRYISVVESEARILEVTRNTIFCVVGEGRLIRCDYEGGNLHTVYETADDRICAAERRWEHMCLIQTNQVICLNLITYAVENIYTCQGVSSAFPISSTEFVWRTGDYRYYVIDRTTDQQREISKEEAEKLSVHIQLNSPEPFMEPEEPTVPDDLVIPDGIDGVITYWRPLEELSGYNTPQQAADSGCVVMVNDDVWVNEDIWIKYTQALSRLEEAMVRIAQFDADHKILRIYEMFATNGGYVYRLWEDGEVTEKFYLYFNMDVNGSYDGGHYNMFKMYTLTNDPIWRYRNCVPIDGGIWEDGSVTVFCNLYYRYDYAPIPKNLQCAQIRNENGVVATIWDPDKLQALEEILGSAEGYDNWPKTVVSGPTLILTGADGTKVEAMVMANGPMIEIDGVFYNYDPGWKENYEVEDILKLFGLSQLP